MTTADSTPAVLITGCSSGIGRATALRLARAGSGWRVWATARRPTELAELAAAGCRTLALDVCDRESMAAAVAAVEAEHGHVAALINNAGYSQTGAFEAVPLEAVRRQFETNVFGVIALTQLVLPGMRRAGAGRIINLSSMGGKLVFPGGGYYHATKHAIEALSDALRFEVRSFGVEVVLIEPGLIKSGFSEAAVSSMQHREGVGATYDVFHDAVARATKEIYDKGPLAAFAGVPDDVAKVIERALAAKRPRARYTVTMSAKLLLAQRRWSSDRVWDWFLRQNFPSPAPLGALTAAAEPRDA
ncbi:MAG: SDR family NAD(P)-dependent oxidoreductase [Deltaproteobacteria bacterium]|nr:SDR family NAD(P)-dependent oxidoreductase [Deltaproteobacteria bacterium]